MLQPKCGARMLLFFFFFFYSLHSCGNRKTLRFDCFQTCRHFRAVNEFTSKLNAVKHKDFSGGKNKCNMLMQAVPVVKPDITCKLTFYWEAGRCCCFRDRDVSADLTVRWGVGDNAAHTNPHMCSADKGNTQNSESSFTVTSVDLISQVQSVKHPESTLKYNFNVLEHSRLWWGQLDEQLE